ncbi:MAG: outer membrane beta-barrel protein [Flavobacteriales bacterium]|nr:outer membrane beta-barrel protein [Flavobacteriales bacterium]
MKKLLTSGIFSLMAMVVLAQEPTTPPTPPAPESEVDTALVQLGDMKILILDEDMEQEFVTNEITSPQDSIRQLRDELTYWSGIDMGFNILLNENQGTSFGEESEWMETELIRSMSWSFNIAEYKLKLVDNYVGLTTGLGFTWNSYGLAENVRLMGGDSTFAAIASDTVAGYLDFDKNKLRSTYLRIPVLLEFNTSNNPDKSFHISVGVVGGVLLNDMNKVKYEEEGKRVKNRTRGKFARGEYNFTPLTLDAHVRVGVGDFTIFANYGLTSLFEDGKGPEAYPLTVGISLVGF